MKKAWIVLEHAADTMDAMRFSVHDTPPLPDDSVVYYCQFSDSEAAMMHIHNLLKRSLIDLDQHSYAATVAESLAAIKAIELHRSDEWVNPSINEHVIDEMNKQLSDIRQKSEQHKFYLKIVQVIAISLLIFVLLLGSGLFN